jgi:hypothetical protein
MARKRILRNHDSFFIQKKEKVLAIEHTLCYNTICPQKTGKTNLKKFLTERTASDKVKNVAAEQSPRH